MNRYAELATASNFSFLRGASTAQDLVLTAVLMGHTGIGIADRNTVAGVARAFRALRDIREDGLPEPMKKREGSGPGEYVWVENPMWAELGITSDELKERAKAFKLVTGSRLVFVDETPDIIVYPETREGWARICRLLTEGNRRTKKGQCELHFEDLVSDTRHLLLIVVADKPSKILSDTLERLEETGTGNVWLGVDMPRRGNDARRLIQLKTAARNANVSLVAVNNVLYHDYGQRDLQDVLTCIREGVTIDKAGRLLEENAERHLKPPEEMARLFADAPEAIEEISHILGRVGFSVDELKYDYPEEPIPPGWTPQTWLEELVRRRLPLVYPDGVPEKVETLLRKEFKLIDKLEYARYFLTIHHIVDFANSQGILCQGRGSAANSAVCFVLGITAVDPSEHNLLFERFISTERKEPPDIDVDFEHERREEVIQHVYEKYGRDRAGIAATVIHYRPRSAIRDVGKALGLTEDVTARLANTQWGSWGEGLSEAHVLQAKFNPANAVVARAIGLASRLLGFPRHLSQHVGGFVLTRGRLDEVVPIGNAAMKDRTFIEWDKDDIDTLGLMKVDVLALGMLTCIRKAFDLLRGYEDGRDLTLATVDRDDTATYDMLCKGESLGVFQVESRAQMNMLPRLKPREFYDLVIQVAIVRPGPIQGNMVHPYLRRRAGDEKVHYPSPAPPHDQYELIPVLKKTYGVPLFQEQAMRLAMVAAGFTSEQANGLRRAMATFRNIGTMWKYEKAMVEGMVGRGYDRDFAQRCFEQIKGFGSYGFPESHAAAFSRLVYISAWLKCHYPAIFACALLNSQPMGFYAPAQIVREMQEHDVEARPIDVNESAWDHTLEGGFAKHVALRLGFRLIDGFREEWAKAIVAHRGAGYADIEALRRKTNLPGRALRLLADADAFQSIALGRREALWEARRMPGGKVLPLFELADAPELGNEPDSFLPEMPLSEHIAADYQTTRLSLKGHPMQILRSVFAQEGVLSCAQTSARKDGQSAKTAGVVLVRQRPGNGKAIFITLEDETGITNVVLWARQFDAFRREIMGGRLLFVEGKVQKSKDKVVHLMAERVIDRTEELKRLSEDHHPTHTLSPADEFLNPQYLRNGHPRNVRVLPKSRDFH